MFRRFSEWAIALAIKSGYVTNDESEEYIYGLDLIMSVILSDIAMLIIGLCMHMFLEAAIFTYMYKCIRKYTGGFHCETALTCFLSSCTMCICVLLAIKYFPYSSVVYISVATICSADLFIMSPIEAINKPLDDIEVKVFGRRARIVISVVFSIFVIVCILGLSDIVKVMAISIADVTLFAVLGQLKLNHYRKTSEKLMLQ